ncbi:CatB-related O-acetyltransferase [Vibrio owensii]|uniref:CatB-related O-acetyltransferase n=1 Tax=Vibrio owensii TaxID=696485 RepID=UPI0021D350CF
MRRYIDKIKSRIWRKNEFESLELREFFRVKFNIIVGLYSYGCFDEKRFPSGTSIGRYCSFAPTAIVFGRNHGLSFISTHPYLYNSSLGFVERDMLHNQNLVIDDDVWIGHNAIILPSVTKIERGSVIAAGSVVTKNVGKYSVVAGNPAVEIKKRFSDDVIKKIESTRWWELDKDSLLKLKETNEVLVFNPGEYYEKND